MQDDTFSHFFEQLPISPEGLHHSTSGGLTLLLEQAEHDFACFFKIHGTNPPRTAIRKPIPVLSIPLCSIERPSLSPFQFWAISSFAEASTGSFSTFVH